MLSDKEVNDMSVGKGMFQSNFTVDQIHSVIGEVVFDVYQIK